MIKDPQSYIVRKESWNDYHLLSLESPKIALEGQPGQFIMVRITEHFHPLLRRPFSIHSIDGRNVEIFFLNSGLGTSLLSQKKTNDTLDILGPLGKGFNLNDHFKEKDVALIGGGRGIAPLYFLAQRLSSLGASIRIFYGGKTLADLPLKDKLKKAGFDTFFSTDDGSFGFKGLITDFFKAELEIFTPIHIFSCGPEPMMAKIAKIAQKKKIPAEFSLESVMGCGFGACWSCVRKIRRGNKEEWVKICEEGPVFSADEIIWKEGDK
ncbi:MAG: dihydroorotate dehydrogenase electron transfer subunit [Candidatus Aminicenantes bacterium]|nr:dihydroorotate dehydrogenase electron transfer subunit [Candidatus Aminicenantes bacterium]